MAPIWPALRGVDQAGLNDNCSQLGGNSLLANQVISCWGDTGHIDMPLRRVFEATTAAELAQRLEAVRLVPRVGMVTDTTSDREGWNDDSGRTAQATGRPGR